MTGSWIPTGADSARLGAQLRTAVTQLTAAANALLVLKTVMAQMAPGTDYTTIESSFGLQTGNGQSVHDIVGSASDALQAAAPQALIQRLA